MDREVFPEAPVELGDAKPKNWYKMSHMTNRKITIYKPNHASMHCAESAGVKESFTK